MPNNQTKVLITLPLKPELVNQILGVDPWVQVPYEPDLLGKPLYATHYDVPIERTPAQEARWQELLTQAKVMFGFDYTHLDDLLELAPRLKWIQGASRGIGQAVVKFGWDQSDIVFTAAGGLHSCPLAEFCLMAMLMFVKDAFRMAEYKGGKHWQRYTAEGLQGLDPVLLY